MQKKMKKWSAFIAAGLCAILILGLFPKVQTYANLKNLKMVNGVITMSFEDKKATTKITYHTVGFIVHKEPDENRAAAYSQSYGTMVDEKKFQQVNEQDIGNGEVRTDFMISTDDVALAMYNAGMGTWKNGQTIYLDSVFEVLHNGASTGRYYYTYDEIANAEGWSAKTKEDLKAYYNIKLTYHGDKFPVNKKIILNGEEISNEVAASVGSGDVQKVSFEDSVTKDGITGTIKKSYIVTNFDKGKQNFIVESGDPAVTQRNIIQVIGGSTVVAEYESAAKVTVRYLDLATQKDIAPFKEYEAKPGDALKEQAEKIDNYAYDYSVFSPDAGKTWSGRTSNTSRNDKAGASTLINFYYKSLGGTTPPDIAPPDGGNGGGGQPPDVTPTPGGGLRLEPELSLSCDPQAIEKGKRATVEFVLDASASQASNGIDYYNFYFNDTGKFETTNPDLKLQKSPVVTFTKTDVKPNTTWYGRVQIVDKKGNAEFAYAEVKIGEFEPEPAAEAHAVLNVNVVQDDPKIMEWNDEYGWGGLYYLTVSVPANWDKTEKMRFNFALDGANSDSTNGIGSYRFMRMGDSEGENMSGPAAVKTLNQRIEISPQEYIDQGKEWTDGSYLKFRLQVEDSLDSNAKDTAYAEVKIKYVFEMAPPEVDLSINKDTFAKGEDAVFTPKFVENEKTYPIKDKHWEITDSDGNLIDSGIGEIPENYPIYLTPGDYTAKQIITYENDKKEDCEGSAEVTFTVYDMRPPDVSIASDKDKYVIPATGFFTTVFVEDANYTFPIAQREFVLKNEQGTVITQGDGIFPDSFNFTLDMDAGYYTASQTIHWWESGTAKEKTAECRFKLISPKPAADFRVDMKMSTAADDWKRIDVNGEKGKVYKQIRIDLSPSIALNELLENPYPIQWDSPNTQICIIPLNPEGTENKERIAKVFTYSSTDLKRAEGVGTIAAKQSIDVRFDEPGDYKIKCRVANAGYIGNWLEKKIVIREDLPPIVDINLTGVVADGENNKIFRNTEDLSVQFGAATSARSQDEDSIDYNTARLDIQFDYNADMDSLNDGVHSQMSVSKAASKLQTYVTVTKNETMSNFSLRFLSNAFPILGKIKLEYSIAEKPKIPNFLGGALPAVPELRGTTELLADKKKTVIADNKPGSIKVEIGKESDIEINVIMGEDTPFFDLDTFKTYYKEDAKIYIIDENGDRKLVE